MISVCICTYNRADSLARTLDSLLVQEAINEFSWELLLIDNNSTDNTREVALKYQSNLPLRYLFEPEQGLSSARNRALLEFYGDLLIFTDDDVVLDAGWLSAYAEAVLAHPEADYFGGRILPKWLDRKPTWLSDPSLALISGLLVYFDLGDSNTAFLDTDPIPFGANFAVSKKIISKLSPFRVDLGVKGTGSGRGEETEFIDRARASGAMGVYLANAVCYHIQDPQRLTLKYMYRYGVETGRAERLRGSANEGTFGSEILFCLRGLVQLLKGRGDRFRQCVINAGIQKGLRTTAVVSQND